MRLVDSIYWPAVQMVMWGFMTQYLLPQASFVAQAAGVLLSGLLLWEVVVRGNLSLSIAFLEEMWSRNLGHLFVSPIRSWEMATGIIIAAFLRTLLGLVPVSLLAWAFFGYNIYTLGLPLVAFFFILQMFSWSIGLAMSGMIMRVGQSAESFAWAAVFILMPVSGVYYPVSVLPKWLQVISYGLPPAYIFEGMRAILALFEGVVTGAADGYWRMADRPASTLLHLGPGLANGLCNLHNAKRARMPVVNIVGEHAIAHQALDAPLHSDIAAMAGYIKTIQAVEGPRQPEQK